MICDVLDINEKHFVLQYNKEITKENINDTLKKEKKKTSIKICIIVLIIVIILFSILLIIFNSNKFEVYKIEIDSNEFKIDNGIFIKSKVKNYFQLGSIESTILNDNDKIYKIKIYKKEKDRNVLVIEKIYDNETIVMEDYGYNEYFNDIDDDIENLFIDITIIQGEDFNTLTFVLKLNKIIESNKLLYLKKDSISDIEESSYVTDIDDDYIIKLLKNNNYILDNNGDWVKNIENAEYQYIPIGNYFTYGERTNNQLIFVEYNLNNNTIDGYIFDFVDNEYILNYSYFIDKEELFCFTSDCSDHLKYSNIVLEEWNKINSN